ARWSIGRARGRSSGARATPVATCSTSRSSAWIATPTSYSRACTRRARPATPAHGPASSAVWDPGPNLSELRDNGPGRTLARMSPKTKYAKAPDGVHLAYQVVGEGPTDIVFVMGWTTNIEAMWREPALDAFLTRLSSMGRLILFDRRGLGLS